ncbi:MAG: hypothetical protein FWB83_07340, partial [Treponema sp.]|nr:hypothetical protein [Treponema sp.]
MKKNKGVYQIAWNMTSFFWSDYLRVFNLRISLLCGKRLFWFWRRRWNFQTAMLPLIFSRYFAPP